MNQSELQKGIELFNKGNYFEAHELFEELWKAAQSEEKLFLHGLTQAAVAMVHWKRGNTAGAKTLLARSREKLGQIPPEAMPIRASQLLKAIQAHFEANGPEPTIKKRT